MVDRRLRKAEAAGSNPAKSTEVFLFRLSALGSAFSYPSLFMRLLDGPRRNCIQEDNEHK